MRVLDKVIHSPDGKFIVCTVYEDGRWGYELYLGTSKEKIRKILNGQVAGRGGVPTDNKNLEFSPSGKYFFLDHTAFVGTSYGVGVYDISGRFLTSTGRGSSTWVGDNQLLIVPDYSSGKPEPPVVYDAETGTTTPSKLPGDVYHLRSSPSHEYILAASTSLDSPALCGGTGERPDWTESLSVFTYPEGRLIKKYADMNSSWPEKLKWINNSTFEYEQVIDCVEEPDFWRPVTKFTTVTLR